MGNSDEKDRDGLTFAGNGKENASDNSPQLVKNGTKDDDTPVVQSIGHHRNRPILSFLGDYIIEMKEHGRRVETLYQEIRLLSFPAPHAFGMKTLEEFERHHTADDDNLSQLRLFVRQAG